MRWLGLRLLLFGSAPPHTFLHKSADNEVLITAV